MNETRKQRDPQALLGNSTTRPRLLPACLLSHVTSSFLSWSRSRRHKPRDDTLGDHEKMAAATSRSRGGGGGGKARSDDALKRIKGSMWVEDETILQASFFFPSSSPCKLGVSGRTRRGRKRRGRTRPPIRLSDRLPAVPPPYHGQDRRHGAEEADQHSRRRGDRWSLCEGTRVENPVGREERRGAELQQDLIDGQQQGKALSGGGEVLLLVSPPLLSPLLFVSDMPRLHEKVCNTAIVRDLPHELLQQHLDPGPLFAFCSPPCLLPMKQQKLQRAGQQARHIVSRSHHPRRVGPNDLEATQQLETTSPPPLSSSPPPFLLFPASSLTRRAEEARESLEEDALYQRPCARVQPQPRVPSLSTCL
mmetsp:Transcript_40066/g.125924  ORF Transcript_40066/g.125924 Transcript_40066/m.125924 type:complete len:364 (+) Transcript_40066:2370-3461(+)